MTTLLDFTLSQAAMRSAAEEFNRIREHELTEFVHQFGGLIEGETLDDAVRRIQKMRQQYNVALAEFRRVSHAIPAVPKRAVS